MTDINSAYAKATFDEQDALEEHLAAMRRGDAEGVRLALKKMQQAAGRRAATFETRDVPQKAVD